MNQHKKRTETGGASSESNSSGIFEYFMTLSVNICGYSEEERNIFLLKNIVPDARPTFHE